MKRIKYFLLNSLLFVFCLPLFAQSEYINGELWFCEYYSNRISDDGDNLWLATSKGLIKYNKSTGYANNAANEVGAASESTFTVVEVNTKGVVCYNEDITYEYPKVWNGTELVTYGGLGYWGSAYSFAFNSKGDVWGSVLGRYFPPLDSANHYVGYGTANMSSSRIQTSIMDMAFDSNDRLWIAMYGDYHYLGYHNQNSTTTYVGTNGDTPKKITSIAIDTNDNIWFASEDGINYYNQITGNEVCMNKEQYPEMLVNRYYGNDIDAEGNIWFTSENNLLKWNGSEFTTYTCPEYKEARAMLCDGDIVWVLLKSDKLLKFQNNEFETIDLSHTVNNEENATNPRGIDLDGNAFAIPVNQLGFNSLSEFTLSFWINAKLFNHSIAVDNGGTNFVTIREVKEDSDYGYMWSQVGNTSKSWTKNNIEIKGKDMTASGSISTELVSFDFPVSEWKYFTFVFDTDNSRKKVLMYIDGEAINQTLFSPTTWSDDFIIMIGGARYKLASLEAYIDKVQLYNKVLSQSEVVESMKAPLQDDTSLLASWDFERGSTIDSEGFMFADNSTIKASMYKVLSLGGVSKGVEIIPFTFAKGIEQSNQPSEPQGIEESITEESNTKAYVSNGVLYIENAEGINSVEIYDTAGKIITSGTYNNASVQVSLPTTIKGVIMVKVNNEVVKVMI